jgi:hypothetical protein
MYGESVEVAFSSKNPEKDSSGELNHPISVLECGIICRILFLVFVILVSRDSKAYSVYARS